MGGSWWELGREKRVVMHQNKVEFVDIWPMLNFQGLRSKFNIQHSTSTSTP